MNSMQLQPSSQRRDEQPVTQQGETSEPADEESSDSSTEPESDDSGSQVSFLLVMIRRLSLFWSKD